MRHIKNKLIVAAKKVGSPLQSRRLPLRFVHENVPYYSQWESRDLVEPIITKQLDPRDDPLWRNSGAMSTDKYAEWSWNGCGMACLKMILEASQNKMIPLVTLGKRCAEYGGYKMPLDSSPGMFYKPFVTFIKKEFGLNGKASSTMTLLDIKRALSKGGYVIASVTPEIRFLDRKPSKRGGHLVLIIGYDDNKKALYLHNPSGFESTQEHVEISYSNFSRYFDHKGIIVLPAN